MKRAEALAADLLGAVRGPPRRRHPERIGLICFIDLIQDAELVLPVAEAARDSGAFEVEVVLTDWLDRIAPALRPRVRAAGFTPIRHARDAVLAGLAPHLLQWDALLTASDTTALPHRHTHALARRARATGLATFTMQHGLENVGLTYRGDGDHDFASEWIFIWGDPAKLPDWVAPSVRARAIGVGRPELRRDPGALPQLGGERRAIVAVFENLHWERFDEAYRQRFVSDLAAAARARPDLCFVVRPHPAGQFLIRNADVLERAANVIVADPNAPEWAQASAADFISAASAVITTPSTIALDAALADKPVAVVGYGDPLEAYAPLPILNQSEDWLAFLSTPSGEDLVAFRNERLIAGDACAAILSAISARAQAGAGPARPPLLARTQARLERALGAGAIPPSAYRRWIEAYDTLNEADREAIRSRAGALGDDCLVSVIVDARKATAADVARTKGSIARQLMRQHETLIVGQDVPSIDAALNAAKGRYATVIDAGDVIAEDALFVLTSTMLEAGDALFAFSDEDRVDDRTARRQPHFKPDWDGDLFATQDYACRLALFETNAARGASNASQATTTYTLLQRMSAAAPTRRILHAPFALYHRRAHEAAVAGPGPRRIAQQPLVTAIVPTRDRHGLLRTCIDGLLQRTDYLALEVVIVDNGSEEPETLAYLAAMERDPRVRVLREPGVFNFSRLNNIAVRAARGDLIALVNNDIAVAEPGWLAEMASLAQRDDVGAVGAMLLYPNGRIQHAGCVLGMGGVAAHFYAGEPGDAAGHGDRLRAVHEVSAITAACLVSRRAAWDQVGGLDEALPVAYNDIDYCLKLRHAGLRILWTPFARLTHHESASRGMDQSAAKLDRLEADKALMLKRWGEKLREDSFYSPNLTLAATDASLAFPPRARKPWRA